MTWTSPPPGARTGAPSVTRSEDGFPVGSGGRFARQLQRRSRPRPMTPQELATGEWQKRLPHPRRLGPSVPVRYLDLVNYLVTRGYRSTRSAARADLAHGRVNVNGKVWAYPHVPKNHIGHDSAGRPRIMVEGVPDPRPIQ